jgi:hypothetical protein
MPTHAKRDSRESATSELKDLRCQGPRAGREFPCGPGCNHVDPWPVEAVCRLEPFA